jgi:hypothetical protein
MISLVAGRLSDTAIEESTLKDMFKTLFDFIQKVQMININEASTMTKKLLTNDITK